MLVNAKWFYIFNHLNKSLLILVINAQNGCLCIIIEVKFWGGNRKENDMDEKIELKSQNISFLNQEICIEAKVTVNPDVSVGKVKIECVESEIEPCSKSKSDCEECTIIVSQLIRVQIPITFSATADAVPIATSCKLPGPSEDLPKPGPKKPPHPKN